MPSLGWRSRICKWGGVNILNPKKTEIGTNVVFDTMSPENITIEEGVIISTGCKIISHYLDSQMTPQDRLENRYPKGKVVIKKNAFLGMGTLVIKPVTIGENAIIGAGSVVTHDIPNKEIWAGNPAKKIRTL
jgi:acetyltransferase-like isoleucine patch superfamily enzyme